MTRHHEPDGAAPARFDAASTRFIAAVGALALAAFLGCAREVSVPMETSDSAPKPGRAGAQSLFEGFPLQERDIEAAKEQLARTRYPVDFRALLSRIGIGDGFVPCGFSNLDHRFVSYRISERHYLVVQVEERYSEVVLGARIGEFTSVE